MSDQPQFELNPSISIIVAGVLIAGAIVYTNMLPPKAAEPAGAEQPTTQLGAAFYAQIAQQLGANSGTFAVCMANKTHEAKVAADSAEAVSNGGQGTPFTLVYDTKTKKAAAVSGALPYEQFMAAIAQADDSAQTLNVRPPSAQDHIIGSPTAPTVLIEYSDFQCPFCARVHPTIKRIAQESNGQIAWVYRHLPLESIHPEAKPAALASECIFEQLGNNGFWKFADAAFGG